MEQTEVVTDLDRASATRSSRASRVARWIEELVPRACGLVFLYAAWGKVWDPTSTHRVLAFDGVPQPLLAPMTYAVVVGEVVLGLALVIFLARWRRWAVVSAIMVLFVYSLQLAYLLMRDNPVRCACLDWEELAERYMSAKQVLTLGLVRNALMAAVLEWVRLRMAGRALAARAQLHAAQ